MHWRTRFSRTETAGTFAARSLSWSDSRPSRMAVVGKPAYLPAPERVGEGRARRPTKPPFAPRRLLPLLTDQERIVYERLTEPEWTGHRRIEQERIPLAEALGALRIDPDEAPERAVILSYAAGKITREEMLDLLCGVAVRPQAEPTGCDGYRLGTRDVLERAVGEGLLTEVDWDAIVARSATCPELLADL